jgi:hypothetical protein
MRPGPPSEDGVAHPEQVEDRVTPFADFTDHGGASR